MADSLEIRITESPVTGGPAAQIVINGRELIGLLAEAEREPAESEGHPGLAGAYAYRKPESLKRSLDSALNEGSYENLYGAPVVCCGGCGGTGCWSVSVRVSDLGDRIRWDGFEHNHRSWAYPFGFEFDKREYREQLEEVCRQL